MPLILEALEGRWELDGSKWGPRTHLISVLPTHLLAVSVPSSPMRGCVLWEQQPREAKSLAAGAWHHLMPLLMAGLRSVAPQREPAWPHHSHPETADRRHGGVEGWWTKCLWYCDRQVASRVEGYKLLRCVSLCGPMNYIFHGIL